MNATEKKQLNLDDLLESDGPVCLVIQADMKTVGDEDTFQPAGFPQIGHVIYKAPRKDKDGNFSEESVCVVDSAASMANHLEAVCTPYPDGLTLHPDLQGIPHVICVTDGENENELRPVTSTLQEGHRIASDYFVDPKYAKLVDDKENKDKWLLFRDKLREEFGIKKIGGDEIKNGSGKKDAQNKEVKEKEKYFIYPDNWWSIFSTIFKYDPSSLVHGVLFAKQQIKITRLLNAQMEAFGAGRVRGSGIKFDSLGKTTSGQPIFATDSETAHRIRATFILDLALLRSYGRKDKEKEIGLTDKQKRLLLELSLWKANQLLAKPFRFRSQCYLACSSITVSNENEEYKGELPTLNIGNAMKNCGFNDGTGITRVYYPAEMLFKPKADKEQPASDGGDAEDAGIGESAEEENEAED